jgi:hypothetical protein
MASVVIAGNTSGSVTLDAPAVAGTTVLTLPATSGTVVTTATTTGISGSAISTGTVGVSVGGTGANTLTANNVILGNGTSAVQFVAPGSTGNVLTSNGTTWTSAAAAGGQLQTELFTAPGTWTKPATATQVRVTVVGGGGGGLPGGFSNVVGGFGGIAIAQVPVSAPVSVTVGAGGAGGSAGATSSFGPAASATGGAAGNPAGTPGSPGSGTVSVGTAFKTGSGLATNAPPASAQNASIGVILGLNRNALGAGAVAYSTSSAYAAGAGGAGLPAVGGGIGGAVIVEYIG